MFKNYLKITLAVMKRRKFFTFISLFGISMTLSILVVLTSFYEHLVGANYPEVNRDRSLYSIALEEEDTLAQGMRRGPMSLYYVNTYIKSLKEPEMISFSTMPNTVNTYGNGKKMNLFYKYTDANFWDITRFEFLEGKAYNQQHIDQNETVVVIDSDTRDDYFGKGVSAVGQTIEINGQNIRVIGVVKGCPITRVMIAANLYLPYHLQKEDPASTSYNGSYMVIAMGRDQAHLKAMQAEYAALLPKIPLSTAGDFKPTRMKAQLNPYFESMVGDTFFSQSKGSIKQRFYLLASVFILLFMSLPAINLVNLNISRIMERSSEIGIRKAFGASTKTLVYQFLIENILLTLLGGILALVLAGLFIGWFNRSNLIPYADLSINWTVVVIALLLSLIFGIMSGVAPAWRMSKLPIVEALKA